MPKGKIIGSDLIDNSAFQVFEQLQRQALESIKKMNDLGTAMRNASSPTELRNATNQSLTAIKNADGALEKMTRTTIKYRQQNNTNLSQLQSLNSAYQQQSRLLISLRQRQKDLNIQKVQGAKLTKAQEAELKRLTAQVQRLDANLKKVDSAAGQFGRNVGNYPKVLGTATRSLRAFVGAFGFTSGIFLMAQALRETFRIFKEFDQAQADLAAILGKSRKEIVNLTKQAKELGATTAFTATQVAQLQLELSKLGFSEDQILASAAAIEQLAIATGVDAARAAKLAGAAIRGFNLDAEEAIRVSSVLAVSTTKSASSFETLEVALPKVSAIAKAFNFTIEDTVALLSGLQNAGFEASIAGTSLRQIFLQLADSNGKLAKRLGGNVRNFDELVAAFKKVESEGIDLAEAFELTNARSVAAFKVFLQGADDLKTLRDSITDVNGELKKLADTKLDSLQGEITLLNSAWEGLVLSVEDGTGSISKFFRGAVKGIRSVFELLKDLNSSPEELQEAFNKGLSLEAYEEALNNLKIESIKTGKTIEEVARDNFFKFTNEADGARDEVNRLKESIKNANEQIKNGGPVAEAYSNELVHLEEDLVNASKALAIKEGRLKAVNEALRRNVVATKEATKEEGEKQKFLIGTIGYYENYIQELSKLQKNTARNEAEVAQFQEAIDKARVKILQLQSALVKFEGKKVVLDLNISDKEFEKTLGNAEKAVQEWVRNYQIQLDNAENYTELKAEAIQGIFSGVFDTFSKEFNFDFSSLDFVFDAIADKEKSLFSRENVDDWANFTKGAIGSVLDASLNRYEIEIQEAQRARDLIVNNDLATDKQKRAAQKKYDEEIREIRIRRAKAERDATLFRIASDTAAGIISALAQIPKFDFGISATAFAALIAATGAAQAALVASRPLPQFFKGKNLMDKYEGPATWGEHRREVKVGADGSVEVSPNRTTPLWVKKDDIITPSIDDFQKRMSRPNSEVFKRVSRSLRRDTEARAQAIMVKSQPMDLKAIEAAIIRGFKKAKINNTIINKLPERKVKSYL